MDRMRQIDEAVVIRLMASIQQIGLQTPISVRWATDEEGGSDYAAVLIAGHHRLEACKRLDIDLMDVVVHDDTLNARLWEIAENLERSELTAQERAEHIAEWVRLTETGQVAQVAPAVLKDGRKAGPQHHPGGINAAARDLGIDRTEAQRSVKIANTTPEAKAAAREAGLDNNQSALLTVARAPRDEQVAKVREISERRAVKPAQRDDAALFLVNTLPSRRIPELLQHLQHAGHKRLAVAVRTMSALARAEGAGS